MDQAHHEEIISTKSGYAKPASKQMGTILLYPMTTKETHHMFSSKGIFILRKIRGSCSRLEFKAGVEQDSHETWGRHQVVRNQNIPQAFSLYRKGSVFCHFLITGLITDNTGLPHTDSSFLASTNETLLHPQMKC